jgi:hypothetical protein
MGGTAAIAQPLLALLMSWSFVPVEGTTTTDPRRYLQFLGQVSGDSYLTSQTNPQGLPTVASVTSGTAIDRAPDYQSRDLLSRETTPKEHTIGEFRRWRMLSKGWDGDSAEAPIPASLQDAVRFSRLLKDAVAAEPMLHATGRAGLFWRAKDLYADLEFLGLGRIAYFIERNGDKHKGVVNFDAKEMPAVFEAVLPT